MEDSSSGTPNNKVGSLKPPCVCKSGIVLMYGEDVWEYTSNGTFDEVLGLRFSLFSRPRSSTYPHPFLKSQVQM